MSGSKMVYIKEEAQDRLSDIINEEGGIEVYYMSEDYSECLEGQVFLNSWDDSLRVMVWKEDIDYIREN